VYNKFAIVVLMVCSALAGFAQQRSAKRGIGWDEKNVSLDAGHAELLSSGVSWAYNWGPAPKNEALYSAESIHFAPMCWNSSFDEARIRTFVKQHPETRYLLGFNEPNFSSQSSMTPAEAAKEWPRVEKLAAELDLILVGPALNFTAEKVGGRLWSPYEWLDEFLRIYPEAKMDCLALHCYMNWSSATIWFATEYFYKDLYDSSKKDVYGKYPNLVAWLDKCMASNGHYPRMMLTEFCSWENDGTITDVDFQIDQMTQKVQMLEQSDLVEGYAWFMANGTASQYPYYSIFERSAAASPLSKLGQVYVNMSSFDRQKHYCPMERILAKDYVDATTDLQQVRLRPNPDAVSEAPLQVEMPASGWMEYLVDVPSDGSYMLSLHVNSKSDCKMALYVDGKRLQTETLKSTAGKWDDRVFSATFTAGRHSVMFYNSSPTPVTINEWKFAGSSALTDLTAEEQTGQEVTYSSPVTCESIYDLNGCALQGAPAKGIYLARNGNVTRKIIIN